jgi:hypothetical protein
MTVLEIASQATCAREPSRSHRLSSGSMRRLLLGCLLAAWAAFWFWAFSFAYSDSFFRWSPGSRLPAFATCWIAAVALPASAWLQLARARRGELGAARALGTHILVTAAALGVPAATAGALARAPEPFHLSGDDAMGVGINFLALCAIALASLAALLAALYATRDRLASPRGPGSPGSGHDR